MAALSPLNMKEMMEFWVVDGSSEKDEVTGVGVCPKAGHGEK